MKIEIKKQLEEKLRKKMQQLPDFIADYIFSLEYARKEIRTRIEYTKDIVLFLEFLIASGTVDASVTQSIEPKHLNKLGKRDVWNYMSYLTSYEKTYVTTTGKTITQQYTNSDQGKARKLVSLHELFRYLQDNELIDKNIAEKVSIKIDAKASLKNRLTPEDMERFYAVILDDTNIPNKRQERYHQKVKFRDYVIVLLLSYTGIRISELVQLDMDDISVTDEAMIVVRKGGNQERVTLPTVIMEDIADYVAHRKKMDEPTKALFVSMHSNRIHPKTVNLLLNKYRERAGISVKISPHVFRRTFGTLHYNRYRDMYLTAQILGHRSAETTRKFYADPSEERKISSMKNFDYEKVPGNKSLSLSKDQLDKIAQATGIDIEKLLAEK